MALSFAGRQLHGSHGPIVVHSPRTYKRRTHYWGLQGETEITGGTDGRRLTVELLIHNNYATVQAMLNHEKAITRLIIDQRIGNLVETGTVQQDFPYCVLDKLERIPLGSQPHPGPLQDVAQTLDAGIAGWWLHVLLTFHQLRVPK